MKKQILFSLCGLALIAIGISIGVVLQREYQLAAIRAGENVGRSLAGLDDPIPPAPAWEQWRYPRAKSKGEIDGSSTRIEGELIHPAGNYAVLVTADDFETVARFYAEKCNFEEVDQTAKSKSAIAKHGNMQGEANYLLDDFEDTSEIPPTRTVRIKCLFRRCPAYDITVFISRAENEKQTHLLLLYDPNVETEASLR